MPIVLITGANRGIGLEFARQYAVDGWKVHACCRNPDGANELKALKGGITVHGLDVSDHAGLKALADKIDAPIDLLIANAGAGARGEGDYGELDYDVWKRMMDVNLYGSVATCEAFSPHVKIGRGKIALISSKMGSIVNALFAVGLVSLPGMMTGQILSGVSPLIAVRCQIMVMCMIFGSAGLSTALFLHLTRNALVFAGHAATGGEKQGR